MFVRILTYFAFSCLFSFEQQHEEQMRAKQAEVASAQQKLALQSGREESFKKMLADAQEARDVIQM